ncbi:hypothetical protein D9M70_576020 [compost metagenome]
MRLVLDVIGRHVQPGAGGDDRGEDRDVAITPDEGPLEAVVVQNLGARQKEIDPPHAEGEPGAR